LAYKKGFPLSPKNNVSVIRSSRGSISGAGDPSSSINLTKENF
jgi:hypothetical protein